MSESVNSDSFSAKLFAAYGTVNYVIVRAGVYTVCSYFVFYNSFACSMSESCYFVCNVSVAAYATSVSGVACFGASGSSNNCFVAMSVCGNNVRNYKENVAANFTVSYSFIVTGKNASRSLVIFLSCSSSVPLDSHRTIYELGDFIVSVKSNEPFQAGH